jgi:hypothetical protein
VLERAGAMHDTSVHVGEGVQHRSWVFGRERILDAGPMPELDGLVVTTEGHVDHRLEDPALGTEQAVHRRRGYAGLVGDPSHGGGRVSGFEE